MKKHETSKTPIKNPLGAMADAFLEKKSDEKRDKIPPVFVTNVLGRLELYVSDPEIVCELFTTKNHLTDKSGDFGRIARDLLGDGFAF